MLQHKRSCVATREILCCNTRDLLCLNTGDILRCITRELLCCNARDLLWCNSKDPLCRNTPLPTLLPHPPPCGGAGVGWGGGGGWGSCSDAPRIIFPSHRAPVPSCPGMEYAAAGASLWSLAVEAGGRPSDEMADFVRLCGSAFTETHKGEDGDLAPSPVSRLWQELSTILPRWQ